MDAIKKYLGKRIESLEYNLGYFEDECSDGTEKANADSIRKEIIEVKELFKL